MKLKITLLLLLSVAGAAIAQDRNTYNPYDFSTVDIDKISTDLLRTQIDSIYRMSGIDSLNQLLDLKEYETESVK